MECVLFGLVLAAIVAAAFMAVAGARRGGAWNEALAHVAGRFHGVLHPAGLFHEPSVWMQHGDARCRLTVWKPRGSGGEGCLQMTAQQQEVRTRCEIYHHENRPPLVPHPCGLAPMEYDWKPFHRRWHVLAGDGDEVRHLLSDGVRLAIDQLWLHPRPAETAISLSPGWLVVRKVWQTPHGSEVEEFVERALFLLDQVNLAAASGIEFVVSDRPQLLDTARCGVCGDNLAAEVVVCRRCHTPHHRECWQFSGGCATYGCGGRECFVPSLAPPAAPHSAGRPQPAARPAKPR